jgi:hypothetical protein
MKKLTKLQAQELAAELYNRTVDFIQEEVYEMLYDHGRIEELDDEAIDAINAILENFYAHHITKHW